ncbi:hypothetical protein B0H63DRAFT_451239 [Podospora didyma]|uniref:F-box domain-containing protein n=1 Tax=Podospora didyma TaxID=330526 RepID=A0AAE0NI89_9PEZI|nr:hypothetical protein B0H63DRAFT_451239 [Podospora didyma]
MTQTTVAHNNLPIEIQQSALLRLLTNSLILCHTTPYLSCSEVLNLAATSRAFRYLVYHTPQVFRRLDLTNVKSVQFDIDSIDHGGETWRNVQLDENLTEDDFYSGPLRGIFSALSRVDILRDVQVLSLDGLSVTAELVHDIISSFSVRILSIRDAKNLNERKLRGALQYACRESRPQGTPRLRGLYVFGPKESTPEPLSADSSPRSTPVDALVSTWNKRSPKALAAALVEVKVKVEEPEDWWIRRGSQIPRPVNPEWANTLVACGGVIAFDSVLCTGPRHLNSSAWGKINIEALNAAASLPATIKVPHHAVATHSLGGCASCGAAPEGFTVWGEEPPAVHRDCHERRSSGCSGSSEIGRFPLLAPPPMHSTNLKVTMCPSGQPVNGFSSSTPEKDKARFIPRCFDCIRDRYCTGCYRWWCESCYIGPLAVNIPAVKKSCWECNMNCPECIDITQLRLVLSKGSTLP